MALSSMTGFARSHGVCGSYAWAWEIKSVNGKGLDLRLRLPPGWDAIEVGVRSRAAENSRPWLHSSRPDRRTHWCGAGGSRRCRRARCGAGDRATAGAANEIVTADDRRPLGAQGRDGGQRHRRERGGTARRRGRRDQRFCRSDRRTRRNAPARRFSARPSADDPAQ